MDAKLIGIDNAIFGMELSLKLQNFVTPYVTEAMMFAYVFYLPLLIITAIVVYKSEDQKGLAEYLFVLSLGYIFCYIGFILFPVASQMYFMPDKYSVSLKAGLFTYFSELIRNNLHFRGGSLPSPHCAAATIILWASYKYNKNIFFVILPSVILLYISTVYGRFHYSADAVTGILTGYLAIVIYPLVIRLIDLVKTFFECVLHPVSIINSLSE
jgi:membrane-associated phospholipid phosphatase